MSDKSLRKGPEYVAGVTSGGGRLFTWITFVFGPLLSWRARPAGMDQITHPVPDQACEKQRTERVVLGLAGEIFARLRRLFAGLPGQHFCRALLLHGLGVDAAKLGRARWAVFAHERPPRL